MICPQNYVGENKRYQEWSTKKNGAALISQLLLNLVQELSEALRKMGKRINVSYF